MNWLKKVFTNLTVKTALLGLVKALVTAALTAFGITSLEGCSALQTPGAKTQSSAVYAFGLPAVVITHDNTQVADGSGDDLNDAAASKSAK